MRHSDLAQLERDFGIYLPSVQGFVESGWKHNLSLAMDAQPSLVTTANNGIPAFLTTLVDPEIVRVLVTPNRAAEIYGETQKGNWTTRTAMFPMIESTGEVASYGDWDNNGSSGANANFPQRQSYHYQTITQYGDRELDTMGEAKINYASELDMASALVLNKFQNETYFVGVAGLQNYGALNDPALPPSISPTTKTAGGTTWDNATADEIFADFVKAYQDLVARMKGVGDFDRMSELVFALAPDREAYLTRTNQYNVNVYDQVKKNFPNSRIETATQYDTDAGSIMQVFTPKIDGRQTSYCGFTEKLRSHGFVRGLSDTKQKKSQGTWGWIGRYPVAFTTMIGI